jgi:hypothetical protein
VAAENQELRGSKVLRAEDWMDDGTPIRLAVEINEQTVRCLRKYNYHWHFTVKYPKNSYKFKQRFLQYFYVIFN